MAQPQYYNFSSGTLPSDFTLESSDPLFKNGRMGNGRSSAKLVVSFPTPSTEGYLTCAIYGNNKQNGFTGLLFRRTADGYWRAGIDASEQSVVLELIVNGVGATRVASSPIDSYSKGANYYIGVLYVGSSIKIFFTSDLENPIIDVDVSSEASGGTYNNEYYGSTEAGARVDTYDSYIDSIRFGGEAPTITIQGDNPTEVVAGENFVEQGYSASDLMLGDLTSDVVSSVSPSVDFNTQGLYEDAVTYSLTNIFGIDAVPVTRDILVRPANYIPVITLPENIIVASGAHAEIAADVSDLDENETFTFQWVQVSGTPLTFEGGTTDTITFNAPQVDTATDLEFTCTVTDSAGGQDSSNFVLTVKPYVEFQRISSSKHKINIQTSTIEIDVPDLSGYSTNMISLINPENGQAIKHSSEELEDGKVSISMDDLRGLKYVGTVWDTTTFPPENGWIVAGASIGTVECYANDMVRIYTGFFPDSAVKVGGTNGLNATFYSQKGAYCSLYLDKFYYSPNGVFDHLDPGEEEIDYVEYETSSGETFTLPITVKASQEVGVNLAGTSSFSTQAAFEEGKIYEIAVTVTGMTSGEITPTFFGDTDKAGKYPLSKNAREVWHIKCPANPDRLEFVQTNGFDGQLEALHIREVLRPDVPVEPRKLELRDLKGEAAIQAILTPLYKLTDGEAPDKIWEGTELAQNSQYGIRDETNSGNFSVVDTFSIARRAAVSLKGGNYCYVDNCDVTGGYTGSSESYTVGFIFQDSGSKIMKTQTMLNCKVDIMHPSHRGDYDAGPNSDPIVLNSTSGVLGFEQQAYIGNCWLADGGDGIIDSKMVTLTNYVDAHNGNRTIRSHNGTVHVIANTVAHRTAEFGNQCLFHMKYRDSRVMLFNVWTVNTTGAEPRRLVDREDLDQPNVVAQDNGRSEALSLIHIAKTIPTMTDNLLFAWDELEMQYRLSGTSEWIDMETREHDTPGSLMWKLGSLADGTYDFRSRAKCGKNYSAYTYKENVEVANAVN